MTRPLPGSPRAWSAGGKAGVGARNRRSTEYSSRKGWNDPVPALLTPQMRGRNAGCPSGGTRVSQCKKVKLLVSLKLKVAANPPLQNAGSGNAFPLKHPGPGGHTSRGLTWS